MELDIEAWIAEQIEEMVESAGQYDIGLDHASVKRCAERLAAWARDFRNMP